MIMAVYHYGIGDLRTVSTFDDSYILKQVDWDILDTLANNVNSRVWKQTGESPNNFGCLLVKIGNAEISEIWGIHGVVPSLNKQAICLFTLDCQQITIALYGIARSITASDKAARFPHSLDTFVSTCEQWLINNHRSLLITDRQNDLRKFAAIIAYNHRWITKQAVIHTYEIDKDSSWLTR